jgi:hypothetical protein
MNNFLYGFGVGLLFGVLAGIFIYSLAAISKISTYRTRIAELEEQITRVEEEYGDIVRDPWKVSRA